MANKDLRDWISDLEANGQLQVVSGADREEEIGAIVDIYMRQMTNPAVMFDNIPGYPKDFRVLANILTSVPRINLALGEDIDKSIAALSSFTVAYQPAADDIQPAYKARHNV